MASEPTDESVIMSTNEPEYVTLPRTALFEFFGKMALPPWRDEKGRQIGGGIDCAPIAQEISEWVDAHEVNVVEAEDGLSDPTPFEV